MTKARVSIPPPACWLADDREGNTATAANQQPTIIKNYTGFMMSTAIFSRRLMGWSGQSQPLQ